MARSYQLVSGDSHLQVPVDTWTDRVPARFRELAPRRVKLPDGGDAIVAADGSMYFGATGSYAGHTPEDFDPVRAFAYETAVGAGPPAQRVQEQDQDGVEAELLFPGTSAVHGMRVKDHEAYAAMVRAYNAYLGDYCAEFPDRLWGVGLLPGGGLVQEKIAEMEFCRTVGLRAVGLPGYPANAPYPTEEDDEFWSAALALEMPITIHTSISRSGSGPLFKYPRQPEGGNTEDDFLLRLYRNANPTRCGSLTACQMVIAGLFERFPGLRIYFAENNLGWIPFYLEQMDTEYDKNKYWAERHFGVKQLERPPSAYIKEHAYWGFFDDAIGIRLRDEIGVEHIIWGSDFPHVVGHWPESRVVLDRHMKGVPKPERRKMEADNLLEFLQIGDK